jgi:Co/Zn/Cd efflux system component
MSDAVVPPQPTFSTSFSLPGMDCPSEERLVRLALGGQSGVGRLEFDLDERRLRVWHTGEAQAVLGRLVPLGFGARLEHSEALSSAPVPTTDDAAAEAGVLRQLLVINGIMFVVELGFGLVAQSTGLLADSLDMFADAAVYGVSLLVVGRAVASQRRAARVAGWLQMLLAFGALAEVVRRTVTGSEPVEALMIAIALLALVANLTCVALLAKHRTGGLHLEASWIFTANDALANLGVVLAGALVAVTGSAWPDLVVGAIVAFLVLWGAVRILRL